ncbi:hypothetical protein ACQPZP_29535 [Spirillospora sp. CA-142024]|uniref:hypothetical protein n=1 Tax=Spirillospora sp. CA-142024 TaxID=3240036 RepID=UPI003D8C5DFE
MSSSPEPRRHFAGRGLVVAGLLSAGIGYALTTDYPALEVAGPMQSVGAVALCTLMLFTGRSPFRRYSAVMWWLIARLAAGNAIVAVVYPFAVQGLTLGTVAAVVVIGYLSVDLAAIWRLRATAWGLKHLCGRALVLGGVIMLNWPLQGGSESLGMLCAVISALCVWNTIDVLGRMKKHGLEDQGAAIANLLAAPVLFLPVSVRHGSGWMSWDLFTTAGLAGLLTLFLPVLLINAALRRSAKGDVAMMQSLSSPVHALVAQVGAGMGWLPSKQGLALGDWAAILLIAGSAVGVSSLKEPPGGVPGDRTRHRGNARRR